MRLLLLDLAERQCHPDNQECRRRNLECRLVVNLLSKVRLLLDLADNHR